MRRFPALLCLLWAVIWSSLGVYGAVSNPRATAFTIQGPDATGNLGFPVAVVQATSSTWPVTMTGAATPADAATTPTTASQVQSFPEVYNGASWDMTRSANGANNTTGTGLLGTAPLLFDGTNYQRALDVASAGANGKTTGLPAVGLYTWSSSSWGRVENANSEADGSSGPANHSIISAVYNYNGTNYDRQYNNTTVTGLASAARTTAQSVDLTNYNGKGLEVVVNVTAGSGGGLTVDIRGKDPISATYYKLAASPTAITATGIYVYELYPGIGAASGGVTTRTSGVLPRSANIQVSVADATSYTYSLNYQVLN